ncbi:MAG: hypothetical protein IOC82_06775 [Aestuariivirga sp.]|uniref:PIN-like domain-containing protein n=1 Tax=Aestuariivirga sp. TaxID=2650926 RepID=UPI0025C1C08E|nr:hypothetical protein [Aestuariivirga sp.]MCA3560718.1 hypothetical protein [Aestuariivirga sp.]
MARRWIIISGDRRITRNKAKYNAFRNSKLMGFFLSSAVYKSPVTRQAARLLILRDDICALAGRVDGGAMFELSNRVRIKQLKL